MKVEVQLRTIAMDFWASLDHKLRYKQDLKNSEEITLELKQCADTIAGVDLKMQNIRKKSSKAGFFSKRKEAGFSFSISVDSKQSIQESIHDNRFCFFLCHAEGSEFNQLFIINSSDCRFMNDRSIQMSGIDFRDGADFRFIHNDRIALDMGVAGCVSDGLRMEGLRRFTFGYGTGGDFAALPSPFICTSILETTVCLSWVIKRSVTKSFDFSPMKTSVSRTLESTPLI